MIQAIVLKIVKDKLISELIEYSGITKDNKDDNEIEDKIVGFLNDHIDIPFIAEDVEEDIIKAIIHTVKALIIEEL